MFFANVSEGALVRVLEGTNLLDSAHLILVSTYLLEDLVALVFRLLLGVLTRQILKLLLHLVRLGHDVKQAV
jgi:hypothetical protein